MNYYQTFFSVITGDTVHIDYTKNGAACYRDYNGKRPYTTIDPERRVENYIKKDYTEYNCSRYTEMIFTSDEVKAFIDILNKDCGFHFELKEMTTEYIVCLYERDYKCHSHIRVALDFLRLLWERDINLILKTFFKIDKKYIKEYGNFVVLQMVAKIMYPKMLYGHRLPSSSYGILTLEQFKASLEANPNHSQGSDMLWYESPAYKANKTKTPYEKLEKELGEEIQKLTTEQEKIKMNESEPQDVDYGDDDDDYENDYEDDYEEVNY